MWQRWNGTSHVFEKSDDNGSSWAPLPLSAATITEGILADARLSANVALRNANNVYTGAVNFFTGGTVAIGTAVNPSTYGSTLEVRVGTDMNLGIRSLAGIGGVGTGVALDSLNDGAGGIQKMGFRASEFQFLGNILQTGQTITQELGIAGSVYHNVRNTLNGAGNYAQYILNASGNSWAWRMHTLAGNNNALDLVIDALGSPVVRMSMQTSGSLVPGSDNSGAIGNSSLRWSLIRGVTITPGDLTFDNGWTVTEGEKLGLGPGLAFLDADENLIAFVGSQGFKDVSQISARKTTKAERRDMKPTNHQSLLEAYIGE